MNPQSVASLLFIGFLVHLIPGAALGAAKSCAQVYYSTDGDSGFWDSAAKQPDSAVEKPEKAVPSPRTFFLNGQLVSGTTVIFGSPGTPLIRMNHLQTLKILRPDRFKMSSAEFLQMYPQTDEGEKKLSQDTADITAQEYLSAIMKLVTILTPRLPIPPIGAPTVVQPKALMSAIVESLSPSQSLQSLFETPSMVHRAKDLELLKVIRPEQFEMSLDDFIAKYPLNEDGQLQLRRDTADISAQDYSSAKIVILKDRIRTRILESDETMQSGDR